MDSRSPARRCPVCEGRDQASVIRIADVPVLANAFLATEDEAAAAPTGELDLMQCRGCGHIFNAAFDETRIAYDAAYDNALHHSATFSSYAEEAVQRLIDHYAIREANVVEIGCGDGRFLQLLCEGGRNTGYGFDPSQSDRDWKGKNGARLHIAGRSYEKDAAGALPAPDLVCCRHVLEHLERPAELLDALYTQRANGYRTIYYFEVPNADFVTEPRGLWDLIYEHVSYFTAGSLVHLFQSRGYKILDVATAFGNQFLWIDAILGNGEVGMTCAQPPSKQADKIRTGYLTLLERWRKTLARLKGEGARLALWGAGSKGVTFLNMADRERTVEWVVDINPKKQGRYLPGTHQRVIAPEELPERNPDMVIVMNPVYEAEIVRQLERLGLRVKISLAE